MSATENTPLMHLGPSGANPAETWLWTVDEQAGRLVGLLDPWCDSPTPNGGPRLGAWRVASYELQEYDSQQASAMRTMFAQMADDEEWADDLPGAPEMLPEVPDEIMRVLASAVGQTPLSLKEISPAKALQLAGDEWRDWVIERTEASMRQLLSGTLALSTDAVVCSEQLDGLLSELHELQKLAQQWESCGGRYAYLRRLVDAIDERRAGLLDVMRSQPTSLEEWGALLRHRLIDHLADAVGEDEMDHGDADALAWTAAMALEAAFTHAPGSESVGQMLSQATELLRGALAHSHEDTEEWVTCAAHTSAALSFDGDIDESRRALLDIYAHLAGAIESAGRSGCVLEEH